MVISKIVARARKRVDVLSGARVANAFDIRRPRLRATLAAATAQLVALPAMLRRGGVPPEAVRAVEGAGSRPEGVTDRVAALDLLSEPSERDWAPPKSAEPKGRRRVHPKAFLAQEMLRAVVDRSQLRRLKRKGALCVVLWVPGDSWKLPLAGAARRAIRFDRVFTPSVKRRGMKPDIESGEVADAVAGGSRILIVTDQPASVPPALVATADLVATISPPDAETLRKCIVKVTGRRLSSVPVGIATGRSYEELVSSIRPSSDPVACLDRLRNAGRLAARPDPLVSEAPDLDKLAGYGEAMDWCRDLVVDVEAWRAGIAPFPGASRIVLSGPPGTGKTMLVRSLARACALPVRECSIGKAFATNEGHLGDVIRALQDMWNDARLAGPCIVFLDELDSIPDRYRLTDRAREWWTPVVNHVLTLIDGATSGSANLILIGATNFAATLDPALVRPGRLERIIQIEPPKTEADCEGILRTHLGEDLHAVDLSPVTPMLIGASGARIMAAVRDARRFAAASGREMSIDDILAVLLPPENRSEDSLWRCAVHEAGHAVGMRHRGMEVHHVSIVEQDESAGRVRGSNQRSDMPTIKSLEDAIVVLLSGAAAEERILGARSVGAGGSAGSDLGRATALAASIHAAFGLSGSLAYRSDPASVLTLLHHDPKLAATVEHDLQRLWAVTKGVIDAKADGIRRVAKALLAARFLTGAQVDALLEGAAGSGGEG